MFGYTWLIKGCKKKLNRVISLITGSSDCQLEEDGKITTRWLLKKSLRGCSFRPYSVRTKILTRKILLKNLIEGNVKSASGLGPCFAISRNSKFQTQRIIHTRLTAGLKHSDYRPSMGFSVLIPESTKIKPGCFIVLFSESHLVT